MQSLIFKRGSSIAIRSSQNMVAFNKFSFANAPLEDKSKGDEKVFFNKED